MHFDLIDLRLFVNIAEAGTITAGAEANHMTLASASERIRGMEQSLGASLLVRERRGVSTTPAGRTLLQQARLVLQQVEQLQGELGQHGQGPRGHIHMLCNTAAMSEILPALLASFLTKHRGLSIDLDERTSDEIVDALRGGVCDLGLVSDSADLAGLQPLPFRADPLVLVVPKTHALAAATSVRLADVAGEAFVGLVKGSALQEHLALQARRLGKRLDFRIRLRSFEAVCRMVGHGVGIAVVPQTAARRYARAAGLHRLRLADAWATRTLMLCVRDLEQLSPHARLLVQHVLEHAE